MATDKSQLPYFLEIPPSSCLRDIVDVYWIFEWVGSERIFPDASMDIVIPLDGTAAKIVGIMTTFSEIEFEKPVQLFGIRFKPGIFQLLTRCSLSETRDIDVELRALFPKMNRAIDELVGKQLPIPLFVENLEWILLENIGNVDDKGKLVLSCVRDILSSSGVIPIRNIAHQYAWSERTLERNFLERVWLTMKEFSRIIRFQNTIKNIQENPQENLSRLACRLWYYDHAHLSNEILRFSGNNPSFFR